MEEIVKKIKKATTLNEVLGFLCKDLAELFHVQKVVLVDTRFQAIAIYRERENLRNIVVNYTTNYVMGLLFEKIKTTNNGLLIIDNVPETKPTSEEERKILGIFLDYKMLTYLGIKVGEKNEYFAALTLQTIDYKKKWSEEEIKLLRKIVKELARKFRSEQLYTKIKEQAERELVIRKIIDSIRSSFEINEIIKITEKELKETIYIKETFIVDLSKSLPPVYNFIKNKIEKKQAPIIYNNIEESTCKKYVSFFKSEGVKSAIHYPIKIDDKLWGIITLLEKDYYKYWQDYELEFLQIVAGQLSIAIKQSNLYEINRKTAEREAALRQIISKVSGSLDIREIKKTFVKEIIKAAGGDIAVIHEYNPDEDNFYLTERDAICSNIEELEEFLQTGVNFEEYGWGDFFRKNKKTEFAYEDINDFIKEYKIRGKKLKILRLMKMKSILYLPIFHGNNFFGVIGIIYIKQKGLINEEMINFLKAAAVQTGIAVYQAKLYQEVKERVEKEEALRKIIEFIRKTFDIRQIKKRLVTSMGKTLKARRVLLAEFNEEQNAFFILDKNSEYRKSSDVISLEGKDFAIYSYHDSQLKQKNEIIEYDSEKFLREKKLRKELIYTDTKIYKTQSRVSLPILYADKLLGAIIISFDTVNAFKKTDLNFLRTLANQAGTTIHQAKLYQQIKEKAERETALRRIAEIIRSTLDINLVKKSLVTETGRLLKAVRVMIIEYDEKEGCLSLANESSEYRKSSNIPSLIGINLTEIEYIIDYMKEGKEILEYDIEDPTYEKLQNYLKRYPQIKSTKSRIVIPIFYIDKLQGILTFSFDKKNAFNDDDVNFIRILANQAGTALYQAKLYNTIKQTAEKESYLRTIIETIKNTLDIGEIKQNIVNVIGKVFNADRCYIAEFDPKIDTYAPVDENSEYLRSPEVKSVKGHHFEPYETVCNLLKQKKEVMASTVEDMLKELDLYGKPEEYFFDYFNANFILGIPVWYLDEMLGVIVLHSHDSKKLSEEDLEFLRVISSQTGIALHQSKLYLNVQKQAERESYLRSIIETIRNTLDEGEIKQKIVNIVGEAFKAYRVYITETDPRTGLLREDIHETEYMSSHEIKSVRGHKRFYKFKIATHLLEEKKEFLAIDAKDPIFKGTEEERFFKDYKVRSGAAIPILYSDQLLGTIVIHYQKEGESFTDEDLDFLRVIASQTGIAIHQSRLYSNAQKQTERERLLRSLISSLVKSFDIDEVIDIMSYEVAKTFNASLVSVYLFRPDHEKTFEKMLKKDIAPDYFLRGIEKASFYNDIKIKTLIEKTKPDPQFFLYWRNQVGMPGVTAVIDDLEKANIPYSVKDFFRTLEIKSFLGRYIQKKDKRIGLITISAQRNEQRNWLKEDIDLLESITDQAYTVFEQAQLYSAVKQTAEKESLLRTIISEIKLSQSLDEAYNYILRKLAEIFNTDRCIFFEIPAYKYEKPYIKYEYRKREDLPDLKDSTLPEICFNTFLKISETITPIIMTDTLEIYKENEEAQEFFKENKIKSAIITPLVRYNHNIRILGIIGICSCKKRIWQDYEIELLNSIITSVVSIVWDITKLNEIENLRNTFMLTLAHDLQVPLVGQQKALEFLISRPENHSIIEYRDFINEMLKENKNLFDLLTKILDSYNYESARKKLDIEGNDITETMHELIDKFKNITDSKKIQIGIFAQQDLPLLFFDEKEIKKAAGSILENAILYTQERGNILINIYKAGDDIITCISDNGPGIPPETRTLIFQRYEMAKAIERKIGSGLSLYLAKQIIEAHKGKIWYETEVGVGTIFCFLLPIKNQ